MPSPKQRPPAATAASVPPPAPATSASLSSAVRRSTESLTSRGGSLHNLTKSSDALACSIAGLDLLVPGPGPGDTLLQLDGALRDASAGPWDKERKVDKGFDGELRRVAKGDKLGLDELAQLNYLAGQTRFAAPIASPVPTRVR